MIARLVLSGCLLAACLGLLTPPPALATSVLLATDEGQAVASTAVVVVEVGTSRVSKDPEYGRPMTHTMVRVVETLYGEAPASFEIEQMGGELDGKRLHIPGDARFKQGERCVLFVRQVEGQWFLTAMEQSKYRVSVHERLGDMIHKTLTSGVFVRDEQGDLVEYDGPPPQVRPLSSLRSELASLEIQRKRGER